MRYGFKLFAEEFGPKELVRQARLAEAAGFDFVEISDHYHPWLESQGHSPFAWTVLGAIAASTDSLELATGVTCPTMRYHPAIIAQAAATLALVSDGRFTLGIGAGERLNEHVVGGGFPAVAERHAMLREALEIIRLLWQGGYRSYRGEYLDLEDARVFDLPAELPVIAVAAGGPDAAKLAAELGDGMFGTDPKPELFEAYHEAGGSGRTYGEVGLAWATDETAAVRAAHESARSVAHGMEGHERAAEPRQLRGRGTLRARGRASPRSCRAGRMSRSTSRRSGHTRRSATTTSCSPITAPIPTDSSTSSRAS